MCMMYMIKVKLKIYTKETDSGIHEIKYRKVSRLPGQSRSASLGRDKHHDPGTDVCVDFTWLI